MADSWLQGEVVRLSVQITDVSGLPSDPVALYLKIKNKLGTTVNTYPTNIQKVSVGSYYCDVQLTVAGYMNWRWESDVPCVGATQGQIMVTASNI